MNALEDFLSHAGATLFVLWVVASIVSLLYLFFHVTTSAGHRRKREAQFKAERARRYPQASNYTPPK